MIQFKVRVLDSVSESWLTRSIENKFLFKNFL